MRDLSAQIISEWCMTFSKSSSLPPLRISLSFFQNKNITSSVNTAYQVRNYRYRRSEREIQKKRKGLPVINRTYQKVFANGCIYSDGQLNPNRALSAFNDIITLHILQYLLCSFILGSSVPMAHGLRSRWCLIYQILLIGLI